MSTNIKSETNKKTSPNIKNKKIIHKKLKQTTLFNKNKKIDKKNKNNNFKKRPLPNKDKKKIKITQSEFNKLKKKYQEYRINKIKDIIKYSYGKQGRTRSLNTDNTSLDNELETIEFIAPYLEDKDNLLKLIGPRNISQENNNNNNNNNNINDFIQEFDDFALNIDPTKHYDFNQLKQNTITKLNKNKLLKRIKEYKNEINELEYDIFNDINNNIINNNNDGNNNKDEDKDKDKIINNNNNNNDDNNNDVDNDSDIKNDNNNNNNNNDGNENELELVPPYCVPIRADVREFDFVKLANYQKEVSGRLFDVIMMDPPWQLATSNPTRGVALGYSQLKDDLITKIPVQKLLKNGLLFVWVINAKYRLGLELFNKWGFKIIHDIAWVKQTVNRRQAHGHGYYLQHAKETCLVGIKGNFNFGKHIKNGVCSDVIYAERRGQSQKPTEIYELIERIVPKGFYLEIFGRRNNLRNGWVTIGNEL